MAVVVGNVKSLQLLMTIIFMNAHIFTFTTSMETTSMRIQTISQDIAETIEKASIAEEDYYDPFISPPFLLVFSCFVLATIFSGIEIFRMGIFSFDFKQKMYWCCCCGCLGWWKYADSNLDEDGRNLEDGSTSGSVHGLNDVESNVVLGSGVIPSYSRGGRGVMAGVGGIGTGGPGGIGPGMAIGGMKDGMSISAAKGMRNGGNLNYDMVGNGAGVGSGVTATCGGESSGDATRRSFYKMVFLSLLCRTAMLPIQAYYFAPAPSTNGSYWYPHLNPHTGMCISAPGCIVSRTLPDLVFASAFSLIVIFYAQLASSVIPSSPTTNDSTDTKRKFNCLSELGKALTIKGLYKMWNMILYALYGFLLFFTGIIPLISTVAFQYIMYSMLTLIYFSLFSLLAYFGPLLYSTLKSSLNRRSALSKRLVGMCAVCITVFGSRTLGFGLALWNTSLSYKKETNYVHLFNFDKNDGGDNDNANSDRDTSYANYNSWTSHFGRDAVQDFIIELIPSLIILAMMHQRKPRRTVSGGDINSNCSPLHDGGLGDRGMGSGNNSWAQQATTSTATQSAYSASNSEASQMGSAVGGGARAMTHVTMGVKRVGSANAGSAQHGYSSSSSSRDHGIVSPMKRSLSAKSEVVPLIEESSISGAYGSTEDSRKDIAL